VSSALSSKQTRNSSHGANRMERAFARSLVSNRTTPRALEEHGSTGEANVEPAAQTVCSMPTTTLAEEPPNGTPMTATPVSASKKQMKWLAFLSHHKQDGGDAARVFVDTARRVFHLQGEQSSIDEGGGPPTSILSSIATSLRDELIFLDSSNLSDLRKLLDHVEESANYILMLTRSTLERPWVLAELVRAHTLGKRMLIITASWPGDESSPQGRGFKFPLHLDEAIDEWQEYYYESTMRARAMAEASQRESRIAKIFAGSLFFQKTKRSITDLLRSQQERPANASTWVPERWELSSQVQNGQSTLTRALSVFKFRPLGEVDA